MASAFGLAFGASQVIKAAFVTPITAAAEFQKALSILQATTGATNEQMKQASATAIRLGADVRLPATSAKDATDAMLELAKAGFTVAQSQAAARGVIQLSTAAQIDNAAAAQIAANSINAFGLAASESTHVADLLAGAANASSASMTDIGEALQFAASVAHQAKVPIDDVVTSIAEMANAGISGSVAGSSLANVIRALQAPTKKGADELKNLGINVFDAAGNFRGIRPLIADFTKATAGMTQAQRAQAVQAIFGIRAQQAANVVLLGGTAAFDKLRAKTTEQGAAQKLAEAQTRGFSGAMAGLRSTVETLQIQIGLRLLPVLTGLVRVFTAVLPPAVTALADAFGFIADVITRISDVIGSTSVGFTAFVVIVGALSTGLLAFGTILIATAVATGILSTAFAVLNAVMVANPITLVIVAIIALAAALVILYQRSATVRAITQAVWGFIQTFIPAAIAAVRAAVASGVAFIVQTWNRFALIRTIVIQTMNAIRAVIQSVMGVIRGVIQVVLGAIHGNWSQVLSGLRQIASSVFSGIVAVIRLQMTLLVAVVRAAMGRLPGIIKGVGSAAVAAAVGIGRAIVEGMISGVKSMAGSLASAAVDAVTGALNAAKGALGIGSPSRLTREQIGIPIMQGIIGGLAGLDRSLAQTLSGNLRAGIAGTTLPATGFGSPGVSAGGVTINLAAGAIVVNGGANPAETGRAVVDAIFERAGRLSPQ